MNKSVKKKIKKVAFYTVVFFFGSTVLTTLIYAFFPVPLTPFMVWRGTSQHHYHVDKTWVPIEEISPHLMLAVIAAEDQLFLDHHGFDIKAIKKALHNNRKGKSIKGGSTISQQTAKNVFLWPSRSWLRKGLEIYFTILIETLWSKQRILEVYLNVIEMGKGIYGMQAASKHHFNRNAYDVSSYQAAMLASIIPSPSTYDLYAPGHYIYKQQDWILNYMGKLQSQKKFKSLIKKTHP